ncbi:Mitochondrial 18kDa protein [Aphelenchoides avenae]|nr:Mitochondrial 18kDa protein [Aphelenchus avenae]
MDDVGWWQKVVYRAQQKRGHSDLYRETPIRLLGYANEVGEAFRAWVPVSAVRLSYVVASGYVCADALDKSHKAYKRIWPTVAERRKHVALTMADTLVWQALASVIIPGITINRLCALTTTALRSASKMPTPAIKTTATLVGLGAIPFIVRPIDTAVEIGMDSTLRTLYSIKDVEQPATPESVPPEPF